MNYVSIAQKYGTPLYIYDFNMIEQRFNSLKEQFKARKSLICYAVKANSNLSLLKHLGELGAGCDCVSIGEVKRALFAKIPKYKIIFSGVGKSDEEIKIALQEDILMLNVESESELLRIENIASDLKVVARISIRVNPNVSVKTHPYISTGLKENKFGVSIDVAKRLYIYAKNSKNLEPIGIHFHIGSQILEISPFKEAALITAELLRHLKALDINLKFFDIGGGVGIQYNHEETMNMYDFSQTILENLHGTDVTIVCEPGRYLVGNCGSLLTKVLYEKTNEGKRFVIVDAAMNDLLRPSLYKAYHEIVSLKNSEEVTLADVVGPVCESSDFLGKDVLLPLTKSNDLLLVKDVGAYGFSMSSNYNSRTRSAEIALKDGKDFLIRRRETFEDLIAEEIME